MEEVNHEGHRVKVDEVDGKQGWVLLRQSLHDPLLPLNIESEIGGGVARIADVLVNQFLPDWDNVDSSSLADYGNKKRAHHWRVRFGNMGDSGSAS